MWIIKSSYTHHIFWLTMKAEKKIYLLQLMIYILNDDKEELPWRKMTNSYILLIFLICFVFVVRFGGKYTSHQITHKFISTKNKSLKMVQSVRKMLEAIELKQKRTKKKIGKDMIEVKEIWWICTGAKHCTNFDVMSLGNNKNKNNNKNKKLRCVLVKWYTYLLCRNVKRKTQKWKWMKWERLIYKSTVVLTEN